MPTTEDAATSSAARNIPPRIAPSATAISSLEGARLTRSRPPTRHPPTRTMAATTISAPRTSWTAEVCCDAVVALAAGDCVFSLMGPPEVHRTDRYASGESYSETLAGRVAGQYFCFRGGNGLSP